MAHEDGLEQQLRELLTEHPGMPRTEMAQLLGVSRKTLYKHLGRLESASAPSTQPPTPKKSKSNAGAVERKPPPGPNKGSFKKGNPGGKGGPPGNAHAVTTGEFYNPLLREFMPDKDADIIEGHRPKDNATAMNMSVQVYEGRLKLQLRRLKKLEDQKRQMVVFEASYTRQEGDGELMGTGRIAQRKRRSLDEEIRRQHAIIDRTQSLYDSALKVKNDMEKGAAPEDPQAGIRALAEAIKSSRERRNKAAGEGKPT